MLYGLALVCSDVISLFFALLLGFGIRFHNIPTLNWSDSFSIFPYSTLLMILIGHLLSLYQPYRRIPLTDLITGTIVCNAFVFITSGALCFWFRAFAAPRSILIIWFTLSTVIQLLTRLTVWKLESRHREKHTILVVGDTDVEVLRIETQIRFDGIHRASIVKPITSPFTVSWDETIEPVTTVVVGASVNKEVFRQVSECALRQGKKVHLIPDSTDLLTMTTTVDTIGDILTFSYRPLKIQRSQLMLKRVVDVLGSLILLTLFSLPILLQFIVIPLSSAGPSLYKQKRVGLDGKLFDVYKFRSMVADAERVTGAVLARHRDPRVTRVGKFIRATRLDELPQLINVLKGDMSLVGPRPERPEFVEQFEGLIQGYAQRHRVRPGITGFAQIMANYTTEAEDKLRYDLWYIRHYRLVLDIKILAQTVLVVLRPSKAKGLERTTADPVTLIRH